MSGLYSFWHDVFVEKELKTTAMLLTACCSTGILKLYERVREERSDGEQGKFWWRSKNKSPMLVEMCISPDSSVF